MRTLTNILLTCALTIGLAMTASAQKNKDQKKPPKKPPAPVINPGEGKKPRPSRDGDKKPKGRDYSMVIWKEVETG